MPNTEKYRLQRLLEIRERAREQAAIQVAECRRQLKLTEIELENRKQAVESCRKAQSEMQIQMIEKSKGGIKSAEIARFRQHLTDLREVETNLIAAVEEQKKTVGRAEQAVEKALNFLSEASKEAKVIDKHRENWQVEKRIEAERREQKSNDEIGAILHDRKRFE